MTKKECVKILENYNRWRRGDETLKQPDPTIIGKAIERAIELLK